jgi:hypothetical protein
LPPPDANEEEEEEEEEEDDDDDDGDEGGVDGGGGGAARRPRGASPKGRRGAGREPGAEEAPRGSGCVHASAARKPRTASESSSSTITSALLMIGVVLVCSSCIMSMTI